MKKLSLLLVVSLGYVFPGSCLASAAKPIATQAKAILQAHCVECHGGGAKASKGGFGFVLDRDQLVSRLLVVPGKAGQSELLQRIHQGEMPPKSRTQRPTAAEVKLLTNWIEAGAPPFDEPAQTTKALSEREVLGAILADLQQLDPRRRRFVRYLTLAHLALAGRPEKDLQMTREAAGKLINSLSWQARIYVPEAIADGAILRIDLRDYKWSAALWEKLVSAYPYRMWDVGRIGNPSYHADAAAIAKLTGTEVAALRADWFVATAARPPLYHDLLQLPGTDRALERLLQVDVPKNIEDDNVLRAGFNDSGVSKNNRLIERHDAVHGALWRSYDFEKNTGRQNLFKHPLGPNTGATSFQPAGGEMIFHLPNGLQGYFLMDAQGRRIDKAPGEIVSDPRRPIERVETGISCMSCHARGLLPKADQLRAHVEKNSQVFGKQVSNTIRALHPRKTPFQAKVDEDNVRYLKALEKFGVRDPDQEPVNLVTQRFEGTLDGRTVAAELGLTQAEFAVFLKQDAELARILGGSLVKGGTVQRQVFEENFVEMARRLRAFQTASAKPNRKDANPFQGHTATVNCVAFSPDGKRAASGSDDRSVRIWDVASGAEIACLDGESNEVYAVAFAHDGKLLLSAGRDKLIRLWDLKTSKELRSFKGHTDSVRCVAFSPDDREAISGGDDRIVRSWNVGSGTEQGMAARHGDTVTSVAWSHDAKYLLSGSRDASAVLWHRANSKLVATFYGHAGPVLSVAFADSRKKLEILTGGNDKTIRLWNLVKGQPREVHCYKGHANAVIQLHVPPGSDYFLSSSSQHKNTDRTWRRWDLKQRTEIDSRAPGEDARFGCAAFSRDGRMVLVGGPGGYLRLWSIVNSH